MIFTLKHPLPGFENINTMELINIDDFFFRLQSQDDTTSFTLVDPFKLRPYEFEIPNYYKTLLDAKKASNLLTLNVMVITKPLESSVINFIAPIIFNTDNKTMVQVLLDTAKYPDFSITESISSFLNQDQEKKKT